VAVWLDTYTYATVELDGDRVGELVEPLQPLKAKDAAQGMSPRWMKRVERIETS
jgi:hypothetical protein